MVMESMCLMFTVRGTRLNGWLKLLAPLPHQTTTFLCKHMYIYVLTANQVTQNGIVVGGSLVLSFRMRLKQGNLYLWKQRYETPVSMWWENLNMNRKKWCVCYNFLPVGWSASEFFLGISLQTLRGPCSQQPCASRTLWTLHWQQQRCLHFD